MKQDFYAHTGPGKRPRFATFDFETDGFNGRVLACSYMTETMLEAGKQAGYYTHRNPLKILQYMWDIICNNHEYHWFAHNFQYELTYFIDQLNGDLERFQFSHRTDLDLYKIEFTLPAEEFGEGCVVVMRDSAALWMEGLDAFTKHFCPELQKLSGSIDFANGEKFDPHNPLHIAYSRRDSHSLLLALVRYDAFVKETFDVHLRWTAAGTALAAWQRTLSRNERYYNVRVRQTEDYIRKAYYGGLVFLTSTEVHHNCRSYDISSSYPYQMITHELPYGNPAIATKYLPGLHGVYHVTVRAPDGVVVPILPTRTKYGIVWPAGTFSTYTTNIELQFALDHGYTLVQVHSGYVWRDTVKPFETFVRKCMDARKTHKGSGLEQGAKRMQNSLSGKFGSSRERRKLYSHAMLPEDVEFSSMTVWGNFYMVDEYSEEMQCLPQWIAFITAHARIHLLTAIYAVGPENVLYGDTDSMTIKDGTDVSCLSIGKDYGQWAPDKHWHSFRARAPKVYGGLLHKEAGLVWAGAAKGLPRRTWERERIFEKILGASPSAEVVVSFTRPERFVTALKKGEAREQNVHRALSDLANSRGWRQLADGRVRPAEWAGPIASPPPPSAPASAVHNAPPAGFEATGDLVPRRALGKVRPGPHSASRMRVPIQLAGWGPGTRPWR